MSSEKKGLSPIAWVGIGCAGIVVLGGIAFVAVVYWGVGKAKDFVEDPSNIAELAIKANPDFEHVSTDKNAKTMKVKNLKTGDTVTMNWDDITKGKFSVTGEDGNDVFSIDATNTQGNGGATIRTREGETQFGGNASLDNVPQWVPLYPNTTKATPAMLNTSPTGKSSGTLSFETDDSPAAIGEYYTAQLKQAGFSVDERNVNAGGTSQVIINANHADNGQMVTIMAGEAGGKRTLVVNYREK